MEAINPEDTHAVQIQSVDNLVNEIRKLTKNIYKDDTRNSSVRSPPPESHLFRSPQDSQSQFFHPYKESLSREQERESGFAGNYPVPSKQLSGLHSKLDEIIKNSNVRRVSSNDGVTSPGIAKLQEFFHVNPQEIRNNVQMSAQYQEQHELRSPGIQIPKPMRLTGNSEVIEKFTQDPPSLARMSIGASQESGFNPFSSTKPPGVGAIKSPVNDTPDYKKAIRSHNLSALDVGLRSPVDPLASNFATNATSVSAGLKDFKNLDSIIGQIDSKSPLPQTLQVARSTSLNAMRPEDKLYPSSVHDLQPAYDKSKLDQILSNIKDRTPNPSSRIASIRVGTTERGGQLGLQKPQIEQKTRVGNFPPSLEIPRTPYDSVPQNKTGFFTPIRESPGNTVQNTYYSTNPGGQFPKAEMGGNYYGLDPGSLTSIEDHANLRASQSDVRENLHYNEWEHYHQQIPQPQGFYNPYNQGFRSPVMQQEEEPEQYEFQPKPKRRASIKRNSRRNSVNRQVEQPRKEEVLWGQVENDDDSLVMQHFDKSGVKKQLGAEKFGGLEDDSELSRASLRQEEEEREEEPPKPQVNDSRNKSFRRERSRQRSAKKQEAPLLLPLPQQIIPDSILAENLVLGDSVSAEPVTEIKSPVLRDSLSAEPLTEINFLLTTEQEQPSLATAVEKSVESIAVPKKSTYTYGQELRRGGSISKQANQEKAPRSPTAEFRDENSLKSFDLLTQFEKGPKTSENTELKKNSYQENTRQTSEILSDFELKDRSNIDMNVSQQKEPLKLVEEPYNEEDSITKAFEHAKLENYPLKKSPKKSVNQTESRGLVAMKTEVVPKSKGFRKKPVRW